MDNKLIIFVTFVAYKINQVISYKYHFTVKPPSIQAVHISTTDSYTVSTITNTLKTTTKSAET